MLFPAFAVLALLVELALGYPDRLFRAIGHPVTWIGRLIGFLDRSLNREAWSGPICVATGILTLVVLIAVGLGIGLPLQSLLGDGIGLLVLAILGSSLLAQRSLASHVGAVAEALETGGVDAGRKAVSMIVGRDPQALDEPAICRAAIESLAENFSDGVVAPAFWMLCFGLPGGLVYKAVNTADSMIGHKTQRHGAFGWASARFDDLVNLPASRLSALLLVAAACLMPGASPANAFGAMRKDAGRHRSPNAGWPEAAMAGALGLALGGARTYGGLLIDDGTMGTGGRRDARPADIRHALRLYWAADVLMIAFFGAVAAVVLIARA